MSVLYVVCDEGVDCGDPTTLLGSKQAFQTGLPPTDTRFPTGTTTVVCAQAAKWSDGLATQTMTCPATGIWTPITATCSSTLLALVPALQRFY